MSIEPGELVLKSSECDQLRDDCDRYRDALKAILNAIDADGPNQGDTSLMLFQASTIARAALKGDE